MVGLRFDGAAADYSFDALCTNAWIFLGELDLKTLVVSTAMRTSSYQRQV